MKLNAKPTELIEDILLEKPKYGIDCSKEVSPIYPIHHNYDYVVSKINQFCNSNYELKNEPDLYQSSFYDTNIETGSRFEALDQIKNDWMSSMDESADSTSWGIFISRAVVFNIEGRWVIKI